MAPARGTSRGYDPARVLTALAAQVESVRLAATGLTAEQRARPSGLAGWDVHHLLVHLAGQIDTVPKALSEPPPEATEPTADLTTWALSTGTAAESLDAATRREAAETEDGAAAVAASAERLEPVLEDAVRGDWLLPHPLGAMRAIDFTLTRLVELVVHSDDLARATGVKVRLDRYAVACTARLLADALAAKAPGRAVELRVPPFAAVQCVAGPRHTRGTPPNVVEAGPLTWIRLATGRVTWEAALDAAEITASGARADLSAHLPVLR